MAGLGPRARLILLALLGAGLAVRLVIAFSTYGVGFDVDAFGIVQNALHTDPLHLYSTERWPYPPGYFPWILVAGRLDLATGVPLTDWVQVPVIAADIAIAWIVQSVLGARGHPPAQRLLACALVALGPLFFVISGFHGQIDAVAILPAMLAVLLWERHDGPRRGLYAGLLIGVGGLIKTVPLAVVAALLPSARGTREGVTLVAAAGLPVAVALLPFALADPSHVAEAVRYRGVPGVGGISLLVQPDFAELWITDVRIEPNGIQQALAGGLGSAITGAALLATVIFLLRRRPEPIVGAALLYMVVWAFGINFFLQYLIWGIPFLLMAGYVREVALGQLLVVPAVLLAYGKPWPRGLAADLFVAGSLGIWVVAVAGVFLLARSPRARAPRAGTQPVVGVG